MQQDIHNTCTASKVYNYTTYRIGHAVFGEANLLHGIYMKRYFALYIHL